MITEQHQKKIDNLVKRIEYHLKSEIEGVKRQISYFEGYKDVFDDENGIKLIQSYRDKLIYSEEELQNFIDKKYVGNTKLIEFGKKCLEGTEVTDEEFKAMSEMDEDESPWLTPFERIKIWEEELQNFIDKKYVGNTKLIEFGKKCLEGTEVTDEEFKAMSEMDEDESPWLTPFERIKIWEARTSSLLFAPLSESLVIEYKSNSHNVLSTVKSDNLHLEYTKDFILKKIRFIAKLITNDTMTSDDIYRELDNILKEIFSFSIVTKSIVNYGGNWFITFLLRDENPRPLQLIVKLIR